MTENSFKNGVNAAELNKLKRELRSSEERVSWIEERYHTLFNNAGDGIIILDTEGHILAVNAVFCERMGYSADEVIGKTPEVFNTPEYASLFPKSFKQVKAGENSIFERMHVRKDGTVCPVEISARAVNFADRTVVMSIVRDITERKQAEQLLFEQQRRYRGIYEYSNDAIFLVRVETGGLYVYEGNNPSHQQSTGFPGGYLNGKTPFDIVPAGMAAQIIANYDNCVRRGAPVIYEEELDLPAGRRSWLTQLVPIPDSSGRIDLIAGISRDITGLKSTTEALHKSEESFRVLIEKAPEAIVLFDMGLNRLVMANANAERLFGCSRDELYNSELLRFYSPEQPDGLPPEITFHEHNERVMREDEVVFERAITNNNGEDFLCEVHLVRIPSANREMIRASFIDITEHKRAQAELALALDVARRTNEEQRQFLGLVSHELRTPLAVIDGAAQLILLKADRRSDSFKEAERIHDATVRLADLIDTCLTDERLSTTGWCPEMHPEDIRMLALKVAERTQACTAVHKIEYDLSGLPLEYNCDSMLLKVLLGNLLDNAVKYSPKGGIITMRGWSGEDGTVHFEVADQGIGIAPDQIDRIFGRFYRVGQDTGIAGAGLGLHLVKQIAELHNGGVSCKSIPVSGSVFTVWLGP